MFSLKSVGPGLLVSSLLVGLVASAALAEKPGSDPPLVDPPVLYEIEWLPDFDDLSPSTRALDVNADGTIVGHSRGGDGNLRAFVYTDIYTEEPDEVEMEMIDLNTLVDLPAGSILYSADCINNAGRIAGRVRDDQGVARVFAYDLYGNDRVLHILPIEPLPEEVVVVHDVSEDEEDTVAAWKGTVVGCFYTSTSDARRGYVWKPRQLPIVLDIENLGSLTGINCYGEIVGRTLDNETLRYTLGGPDVPEILSDTDSVVRICRIDVNDGGVVAGTVARKGNRFFPGLYTDADGWKQLTLTFQGYPAAINKAGQICGIAWQKHRDGPDTGFVYDPVDEYWLLDDLIVGPQEDVAMWFYGSSSYAEGISDPDPQTGYGTVVGYKNVSQYAVKAFVLWPCPPSQ